MGEKLTVLAGENLVPGKIFTSLNSFASRIKGYYNLPLPGIDPKSDSTEVMH